MKIDLLYFDDCPSWKIGLENLKAALSAEGLQADIQLIQVANNEDADRYKFLGSPSFLVNGVDPWSEEREQYNLSCRVYPTPQGMRGAPSVDMLREKLRTFITS
ncbi:thioredoxin family protein [Chloroflexota bacterium]